ncbi:MAG: hypothetical protein DHS20C15_31100 [Planctomycetota bacterium]|nr:MAG: hypothetical protein DHS20C15_31100 [Planctomycetota bacterium]
MTFPLSMLGRFTQLVILTQGLLMLRIVALCFSLCLFSCAQVRVGVFSRPYLDVAPQASEVAGTPYEQDQMQTLEFAGYRLRVSLDNDIQTSDTTWVGVEVPMLAVGADAEHQWRRTQPASGYCLTIRVQSPREGGQMLARDVVLQIDGQRYTPSSASHVAYGEHAVSPHQLRAGEAVALSSVRPDVFKLCFEVARPEPTRELALNLTEAFVHPQGARLPVVRFEPTAYRESR